MGLLSMEQVSMGLLFMGSEIYGAGIDVSPPRSGKLKVPDWVDTVKLAKHKELAPLIYGAGGDLWGRDLRSMGQGLDLWGR